MDRSGSIGSADFKLEKTFVENLIEYFDIFPTKNRVAVVTYSTFRKLEFNFNKYINKDCLRNGIQDIRYEFIVLYAKHNTVLKFHRFLMLFFRKIHWWMDSNRNCAAICSKQSYLQLGCRGEEWCQESGFCSNRWQIEQRDHAKNPCKATKGQRGNNVCSRSNK